MRDRWKGERPARDHHTFFAGGPFVRTGAIRTETAYNVSAALLVDRVLSRSTSSPEKLGDRIPAMRREMLEALAPLAADGAIRDVVEAQADVYERAASRQGRGPRP